MRGAATEVIDEHQFRNPPIPNPAVAVLPLPNPESQVPNPAFASLAFAVFAFADSRRCLFCLCRFLQFPDPNFADFFRSIGPGAIAKAV
jgi:hypothetical protein